MQKNVQLTLKWIRQRYGYPLVVVFCLPWILVLLQYLWIGQITVLFALVVMGLFSLLFFFLVAILWLGVKDALVPVGHMVQRLVIRDGRIQYRRPIISFGLPILGELADRVDDVYADLKRTKSQLLQAEQNKIEELGKASVRYKWVLEQLRPHLQTALNLSQLIRNEGRQKNTDEIRENLQLSLEQSLRLLDEYREIASPREELVLYPEPMNLRVLFESLKQSLSPMIERTDVHLEWFYPDSLPDEFLADRVRIYEVLHVIVGYAVRFAQKGKVRVEVSQQEDAHPTKSRMIFRIQDEGQNGPGMRLEYLIEPFLHPENFQIAVRAGNGPGLAFAVYKQIVEHMRGHFKVSTTPQGWNQYEIQFDLDPAVTHQMAPGRISRVLLVDDNKVTLKMIAASLKKMNLEVFLAEEMQKALEILAHEQIDLLITDLYLEDGEGVDLAQQALSMGFDKPILGMTATNTDENRIYCKGMGMYELLSKPFRLEEWRPILRVCLGY